MSDSDDDFNLADLLTVDQIVERCPVLTRGELLSAMRSKRLRHWPKGRQRYTTEQWIREWIMTQVQGGEGKDGSRGAAACAADRRGCDVPAVPRMTLEQEEVAAALLAQSISRKPRKTQRTVR